MNRWLSAAAALVLTLATIAHAQATITGRWEGTTGGGRQVVLDLKADGDTLTGTLTVNQVEGAISEGKIDGARFSFKAPLNDQPVTFKGALNGDEIEVTPEGAQNSVTLKRVVAKKSAL